MAQGPPKRDAREAQASNGESVLFATGSWKKAGWGGKIAVIAGIADIARDREKQNRTRATKNSEDRKIGTIRKGCGSQDDGIPGVESRKSFGMLIEVWGEGSGIADIARDRKNQNTRNAKGN